MIIFHGNIRLPQGMSMLMSIWHSNGRSSLVAEFTEETRWNQWFLDPARRIPKALSSSGKCFEKPSPDPSVLCRIVPYSCIHHIIHIAWCVETYGSLSHVFTCYFLHFKEPLNTQQTLTSSWFHVVTGDQLVIRKMNQVYITKLCVIFKWQKKVGYSTRYIYYEKTWKVQIFSDMPWTYYIYIYTYLQGPKLLVFVWVSTYLHV